MSCRSWHTASAEAAFAARPMRRRNDPQRTIRMTTRYLVLLLWLAGAAPAIAQTYDIVLSAGRVMDPESGLDAVRNVGITGDRIMRISEEPLQGKRVIDVRGLI